MKWVDRIAWTFALIALVAVVGYLGHLVQQENVKITPPVCELRNVK